MPAFDRIEPDAFRPMQSSEWKQSAADVVRGSAAGERALWALADQHIPPDVREMAHRWKMDHTLVEMYRAAFIAGWRAAVSAVPSRDDSTGGA